MIQQENSVQQTITWDTFVEAINNSIRNFAIRKEENI